jgi:hypothetical protein
MDKKARVIAFYLPQFHPIPENDEWWGKGFTEWTNVGKAKPLFRGHYQPKVPKDLGYYDLRVPEVREQQAQMARESGVEGFMYWHYWFGNGKVLLERPFQEVLNSGKPDFPFCLGWANHTWANKTWDSKEQYKRSKILIEQLYPGINDYKEHFFYVLNAFKDKRYITIDQKPIFFLYAPLNFFDIKSFISIWRNLAKENGLNDIYFIGQAYNNSECNKLLEIGFDGVCRVGIYDAANKINGKYVNEILNRLRKYLKIVPLNKYKYSDIVENIVTPELDKIENIYPTVIPNFDHTPRSYRKGLIYINSTPALFKKLLRNTINVISEKKDEHKIIFLRSWNEWAEGNYVEPDLKFGHGYLDAIRDEILLLSKK